MYSYLVRIKENKEPVAIIITNSSDNLFWEVDKELDPHLCEYKRVPDEMPITLFFGNKSIENDGDEDYDDYEHHLDADCRFDLFDYFNDSKFWKWLGNKRTY